MQIERLAFVAFPVADLVRSRDFYSRILGAQVVNETADWMEFDLAGTTVRAYLHKGDFRHQHSGLQFIVPDVDGAYQELKAARVDLRSAIRSEAWGGRVFTVADPDGNLFDLLDASYANVAAGT
jgi:catechol 2,3-dioxygenase-like lactoylglutathione lyase family enzyme